METTTETKEKVIALELRVPVKALRQEMFECLEVVRREIPVLTLDGGETVLARGSCVSALTMGLICGGEQDWSRFIHFVGQFGSFDSLKLSRNFM